MSMRIDLDVRPIDQIETDALVVAVFDKNGPGDRFSEAAAQANSTTSGWLDEVFSAGEISGKLYETAVLHRPQGLKARRLVAVGLGKREKYSPAVVRNAAAAAIRVLRGRGVTNAAMALDAARAAEFAEAAAEGALLGDYEPDRYKTEDKDTKPVESFTVSVPGGGAGVEEALQRARIVAEAQNFARELAMEPANRLTPMLLAERARAMAGEQGLECEVLDQDRMRQLGMGALLGVAQGSAEPPCLIVLRYKPEGGGQSGAHLGIVGKGVTFDTGGISIKPSDNMDKMKYDMSGGAAAIGAMRALAQLKPAIPVTALIPAVENMPGSRAQRPGDIVTTLAGKTVEVLNTDAEGRLILADALTYAQRLGCTHLVNAATLTGAIVVALGHVNVGVFSNDDQLRDKVLAAAGAEGEKMWPMPFDDEYKEQLKSGFADLPNIGTRWGGSITAAMFLKEFADPKPWVHLDIAGTAWLEEAKPYMPKGPTGVGVRTFVRLATNW